MKVLTLPAILLLGVLPAVADSINMLADEPGPNGTEKHVTLIPGLDQQLVAFFFVVVRRQLSRIYGKLYQSCQNTRYKLDPYTFQLGAPACSDSANRRVPSGRQLRLRRWFQGSDYWCTGQWHVDRSF
jgi:hypothetical protein